jgi:uncharacterized membrane protein YkoI
MLDKKAGKFGASVAALAAIAVGASAVAGAASGGSSTSQNYAPQGAQPQGGPPPGGFAGHKPETPLSGAVASKVRAAALAKVPGGTIERVETDSDHGSPYEAHVRKSDGTELEVLVDKSFAVTAVNAMRHP